MKENHEDAIVLDEEMLRDAVGGANGTSDLTINFPCPRCGKRFIVTYTELMEREFLMCMQCGTVFRNPCFNRK